MRRCWPLAPGRAIEHGEGFSDPRLLQVGVPDRKTAVAPSRPCSSSADRAQVARSWVGRPSAVPSGRRRAEQASERAPRPSSASTSTTRPALSEAGRHEGLGMHERRRPVRSPGGELHDVGKRGDSRRDPASSSRSAGRRTSAPSSAPSRDRRATSARPPTLARGRRWSRSSASAWTATGYAAPGRRRRAPRRAGSSASATPSTHGHSRLARRSEDRARGAVGGAARRRSSHVRRRSSRRLFAVLAERRAAREPQSDRPARKRPRTMLGLEPSRSARLDGTSTTGLATNCTLSSCSRRAFAAGATLRLEGPRVLRRWADAFGSCSVAQERRDVDVVVRDLERRRADARRS